ncbi:hypothetical protein VPHK469_0118 [Vibrio phage K469]
MNTVSHQDELTAIASGVILLTSVGCPTRRAQAYCCKTGKCIRNDNETWVRSQLELMRCPIIHEIESDKELF